MKTIYKSVIVTVLGLSPVLLASAQQSAVKDTVLNRHILLEREFNPTLQDASKINTLPAIHEPVIKDAAIEYEAKQPAVNLDKYPIGNTGVGDILTKVSYDKRRGYLNFDAGSYSNLGAAFGYRVFDNATDELDVFGRYSSTDGVIGYADRAFPLSEAKAKYSDMLLKAKYQHTFVPLTWYLYAGYENLGFNYYGNPFNVLVGDFFDMKSKQSVGIISAETGVKSNSDDPFRFTASLAFDNFSANYGPSKNFDGVGGNLMNANLDLAAPFDSDKFIGLRFGILNQSFGSVDFVSNKNEFFHNMTRFRFNPYFDIEGGNYNLSLGVNTDYIIDNKNKFLLTPNVDFSWTVANSTNVYSIITGGINDNNYLHILRQNRYVDPALRVKYSNTLFDGTLGVRSGIVKGLEFDIFGGFKYTKDEHLFVVKDRSTSSSTWANVATPDYFNVSVGHFGGLIKTSLIPCTDLSAKIVSYFYNVSGNDYDGGGRIFEAWNLPTITLNLNADVKVSSQLTISANYYLAAGRKAFYDNKSQDMNDINELNFRGEYKVQNWLSINGGLNNVLNKKYETWAGYTHQGFNVFAGVGFVF